MNTNNNKNTMFTNETLKEFIESNKLVGGPICVALASKLEQLKKISKVTVNSGDIDRVLQVVDQINSLPKYTRSLNGVPLREIYLPEWVKPFVLPANVVMMNPADRYLDLALRPETDDDFVYDEADVRMVANHVAGMLKTEAKMFQVEEFRNAHLDALVADVHFAVSGWVYQKDDELFVPVNLSSDLACVFGEEWYNTRVSEMLARYIQRKFSFVTSD